MIDMTLMTPNGLKALAIVNFVLCTAIGWSCVCRFALMSSRTVAASWRLRYVVMLVAAVASGWSPVLFGEWPGPGQIFMAAGALFAVGMSARSWRGGPPEYARPRPPL